MTSLGTAENPLRVAIVGSGPSGFYAAQHLQKQLGAGVQIDMFDRLPTPFGLVRGGVAPDHQTIKAVTKVYDKIAADPTFRFYGHVDIGTDITHEEMGTLYHAVIYAVGAQSDRKMGVPGEDLAGSHAATEFVGWYNAHPDFRERQFDLTQERVAVIGNGNVAMDVVRILAKTYDELKGTDIADYALEALKKSQVKEIYVLGRRGPAQAAFTTPEIKELGELADATIIVRPEEVRLDALSAEDLERNHDAMAEKNIAILQEYARRATSDTGKLRPPKKRRIYMRFLTSPVELIGTERVEKIRIVKNELYVADDGSLRPRATEWEQTIPVGLVFRSIGYKGVALPGLPFDERSGIMPNQQGRVLQNGAPLPGTYCVGWIKRGPTGIIGTNKPDSIESVEKLLEDLRAEKLLAPSRPTRAALEALLAQHKTNWVSFADWQILDRIEQAKGMAADRLRVKFSRIDEMLKALAERKGIKEPSGD
ncbi:MAG: FAD-dependent oxidoreductase [Chloroflexi bacterium]|nr:FAD-dependent oxidoreductase [Chloroflexota bacterium]